MALLYYQLLLLSPEMTLFNPKYTSYSTSFIESVVTFKIQEQVDFYHTYNKSVKSNSQVQRRIKSFLILCESDIYNYSYLV